MSEKTICKQPTGITTGLNKILTVPNIIHPWCVSDQNQDQYTKVRAMQSIQQKYFLSTIVWEVTSSSESVMKKANKSTRLLSSL